ncbi:MATE family efflux transporter [Lachnoclostridium phytofermentans]|uniref:MATE family efflux transporter n=1 Tax=Lachnoclostridium phytofermentans TaxID=66219 RepID=UPI000496F2F9|nr:MATE family efflux transporter [Lachnoclostridium phytofermentans]
MSKKTYINDMTQGSPTRLLVHFAVPMLIGNLFQQLYSMVDSIVVGNVVGDSALAAVGSTWALNFCFRPFICNRVWLGSCWSGNCYDYSTGSISNRMHPNRVSKNTIDSYANQRI